MASSEIGTYTPEQARAVLHDYMQRQQLAPQISQNYPQRRLIDEVSPHRVFIKNTEEETIPPYGCCRITGTQVVSGRTALLVEKPSAVTGEFVFNSPYEIPAGETGWAFRFGIVIMLGNGTPPTAANVEYKPIVDSFDIAEGAGPFVVFGEHNVTTDALIGRFTGGGGTETAWATITASGHDAEIQTVDVYRSAKPTTFPTFDCGDATFIDFAYTLSDLIGTRDVLVPAGYRAGTACLLKFSDSDPGTGTGGGAAQAWDGWVVVAANLERCTITTDHDPECCPIEGLKMTRFEDYWIVGGHIGTRNDPCEAP